MAPRTCPKGLTSLGPDPSTLHSPPYLSTPSACPPKPLPQPLPPMSSNTCPEPLALYLTQTSQRRSPTLSTPSPRLGPGPRPPKGEESCPLPLPEATAAPQQRPQCQSHGGRDCSLHSAPAAAAAKDAQQTMRGPGRLRQPPQPPP